MDDTAQKRLNDLYALGRKDPDVKLMIDAMTMRHSCDVFTLAEEHPDAIDDLYEAAHAMLDQLGDDTNTFQ